MFRPHQIPLCCPCGNLQLFCRGFCRACYGRRHRSRTHFSGLRGKILARDHHRCRVCGAREQLAVHHRRPRNVSNALITLCAACHARLHRLAAMDRWIPEFLAELWTEQHPGVARQIQFPEAARRCEPCRDREPGFIPLLGLGPDSLSSEHSRRAYRRALKECLPGIEEGPRRRRVHQGDNRYQ